MGHFFQFVLQILQDVFFGGCPRNVFVVGSVCTLIQGYVFGASRQGCFATLYRVGGLGPSVFNRLRQGLCNHIEASRGRIYIHIYNSLGEGRGAERGMWREEEEGGGEVREGAGEEWREWGKGGAGGPESCQGLRGGGGEGEGNSISQNGAFANPFASPPRNISIELHNLQIDSA